VFSSCRKFTAGLFFKKKKRGTWFHLVVVLKTVVSGNRGFLYHDTRTVAQKRRLTECVTIGSLTFYILAGSGPSRTNEH
jgi:hypothetical protein